MNLASDIATTPGWYGKLPSLGDFASRRLEADFVEAWDLWLGEGLQAQREALGEGWLEAYLQSPAWRFVLRPGALASFDPGLAVVGILMPSVDRVGRYFPLTIAASMAALPASAAQFGALLEWLRRLEDTGLAALQQDWTIEQLEAALASVGSPAQALRVGEERLAASRRAIAAALADGGFVELPEPLDRDDIATLLVEAGRVGASSSVPSGDTDRRRGEAGIALWLAGAASSPRLLLSRGLPAQADFVSMFSGGVEPAVAAPAGDRGDPPAWSSSATPTAAPAGGEGAVSEGDDLLGLFATPVERGGEGNAVRPAPQGAPSDLDATAARESPLAPGAAAAADKAPDDDILAMFDADRDPGPDSVLPESELETRPGSPDILDLFGASNSKPDFDKTR